MLDRHGVGNWGHVSWNIYGGHLVITTFLPIFVLHTFSAKRAKHLQQWLASVQSIYNYRVIFLTGPPCSVLKLNIANEPTGAAVPWTPSSERPSDWPVSLFNFGTEQVRASRKNQPVYIAELGIYLAKFGKSKIVLSMFMAWSYWSCLREWTKNICACSGLYYWRSNQSQAAR